MLTSLHKKTKALNQQRCALLDELTALDVEWLEAKPIPNKWSILEIVEHLVIAEEYVFKGFPKIPELVEQKRKFKNRFTRLIVIFVLRNSIPVKAPSPKMLPQGNIPLAKLKSQWDQNHQLIKSYVDNFDSKFLDKAFFEHPVTGSLTLEQAIDLDQIHLNEHIKQIRKLLTLLEQT